MDQTAESTFSFGIEPSNKRAYHHSCKYRKTARTRRRRRNGLKHQKAEENTGHLVLVGFIGIPSAPVAVSEREVCHDGCR
ncbi:MAG: hypothetical protein WCR99_12500 [Sphaerochaeta sp.]